MTIILVQLRRYSEFFKQHHNRYIDVYTLFDYPLKKALFTPLPQRPQRPSTAARK